MTDPTPAVPVEVLHPDSDVTVGEGSMTTSLEPTAQTSGIIVPAATESELIEAFDRYQNLKTVLGRPGDFQEFYDKKGDLHSFPKKSFVRKVARYFNISAEEVPGAERLIQEPDGSVIAVLTRYRAVAPNGAFMEGDGSCERSEKSDPTVHNIRSHAHTRAKNRAIMDLCGFGDVTADELRPGDVQAGAESGRDAEDQGHGICQLHNVALKHTAKQKNAGFPPSHYNDGDYCRGQVDPSQVDRLPPAAGMTRVDSVEIAEARRHAMQVLLELKPVDTDAEKWMETFFPALHAAGSNELSASDWHDVGALALEHLEQDGEFAHDRENGEREDLPW